jgi:hypothetical protein
MEMAQLQGPTQAALALAARPVLRQMVPAAVLDRL